MLNEWINKQALETINSSIDTEDSPLLLFIKSIAQKALE